MGEGLRTYGEDYSLRGSAYTLENNHISSSGEYDDTLAVLVLLWGYVGIII